MLIRPLQLFENVSLRLSFEVPAKKTRDRGHDFLLYTELVNAFLHAFKHRLLKEEEKRKLPDLVPATYFSPDESSDFLLSS